MTRFADVRWFIRASSARGAAMVVVTTTAMLFGGPAARRAVAQVAVTIEKYSGTGSVVAVDGPRFQYLDEAGKQFVVSSERVYNGVAYSQLEPLQTRIRGAFSGERLEPGMLVAFPAVMVGRRVVEPVERLTIVSPGAGRVPGIHELESLPGDSIFGQFLGEPAAPLESEKTNENGKPTSRVRDPRDRPAWKFVIGQVSKAPAPNRFTVSAGERIDVGATLADKAFLFVDSTSVADLATGDPVKLEGALIGEGAMFAVQIEVERPTPPEALEKPKSESPDGDAATEKVALGVKPPAPAGSEPSGVKPPGDGSVAGAKESAKPASDAKTPAAVRGRVVEVN